MAKEQVNMFSIAILIGIYSYIILTLGLTGILYKKTIVIVTLSYLVALFFFYRNKLSIKPKDVTKLVFKPRLITFLLLMLMLQLAINFIGVLGPEIGFDALWYHLTLPKIYLDNHAIFYIPGGLLYYSLMPKLTEMIYVSALTISSEIGAKFIHFSFGVLSLIALYKVSRNFFDKTLAMVCVLVFSSNLVFLWEQTTAYVDLARTFFEIMALWGFLKWVEKKDNKWLIESAVMLGLAVSTKLLALGSIFVFSILIGLYLFHKKKIKDFPISLSLYFFISLLVPLPWFVLSFVHTGNPFYPFFTTIYPLKLNFSLINPLILPDPISPLYIILLPIGLFVFRKFNLKLKFVAIYFLLAFFIWYLTLGTGGSRFLLPYLPAFSILSLGILQKIQRKVQYVLIGLILFFAAFSIIYRFSANLKYLPVIFGSQSKSNFLSSHLNFSFSDFYDTDNYFKNHIGKGDVVLLYGFHNLYYVDFPFIDSSWVKRGDQFTHIATQNTQLPNRFKYWSLIYQNRVTHVKVYSLGGQKWVY